jgi:general L-amino acid transport system permease protein
MKRVADAARMRALVYQASAVGATLVLAWFLISNTVENLAERNIASGFSFLEREAGFAIGETTWLSYSPADTYLKALAVGVANTLRVALIGIVAATILGTLVGLARLSRNWLLAKFAAGYVEFIRNVPLLVQLFFIYALIIFRHLGRRGSRSTASISPTAASTCPQW